MHVNIPVVVGGQIINPGDVIVADEVGVCVVPQGEAEAVVAAAEQRAAREDEIRTRIASGASVSDLVARYGHL